MKAPHFTKTFPIVSLFAIPSLLAQKTVLLDDMSGADANYTVTSLNSADSGSNPTDTSAAFFFNPASGGNPDSRLQVFHRHDVQRDGSGFPVGDAFTELRSFYSNDSLSYLPSVEGIIQSISLSIDLRTTQSFDAFYFTINDANGNTVANGDNGLISIKPNSEYQTLTLTGVTQEGAVDRDFAGSKPLFFGFGLISFSETTGGPVNFLADADNFRIEVTPVPEPSSALLLAFGLSGLIWRRR